MLESFHSDSNPLSLEQQKTAKHTALYVVPYRILYDIFQDNGQGLKWLY